ncbi:MAG: 3-deoxy-manno-octulosonate cytidylyltransferase, partial [Prevotellaceae bacterium]|nr:3-deoxy-manno-octulosonate cytidylyltransferase [Prevotellaceae bacterium]
AEAAAKIRLDRNTNFETIVNIQGDEPFIVPEQLQQLIKCISSPDTQIATLVKPFAPGEDIFHPNAPKVVLNHDSEAIYFSRSTIPYVRNHPREEWSHRCLFYKHVGLYAYHTAVLMQLARLQPSVLELAENLEQLRWIENGFRIKVAITDHPTYAVDVPEDLQRLHALRLY